MILIEKEDVLNLGMDKLGYPFHVRWEIGSPEAIATDYADIIAEGPFLCVVTDEEAWAGQTGENLQCVAQKRADPINLMQWRYLADMYAEAMGVSRQGMILRFAAVQRHLAKNRDPWFAWDEVYHWPEGGDLAWSAFVHARPSGVTVREHNGQRQIRYPRPPLDVKGILERNVG